MVDRPSKALLLRLYVKQGQSSTEIGKAIGAHPGSVRKWLKQYGITTRKPEDYRNKKAPYPLKARLVQLRVEEKRTSAEMASHFRVSVSEIHRLLDLFGIARPEPKSVVRPPAPVEHVVANQWNTDPEFAPYWHKVVERKELPYARNIDGTLKYISMDTLSCGHTMPTGRKSSGRSTPYGDPSGGMQYHQYDHRVCSRCKQEAEFDDE